MIIYDPYVYLFDNIKKFKLKNKLPISVNYTSKAKFTKAHIKRLIKFSEFRNEFVLLIHNHHHDAILDHDFYKNILLEIVEMQMNEEDISIPINFNFDCNLTHDLDSIGNELDEFKKYVIKHIINMRKEIGALHIDGTITDKSGRDITDKAFKVMNKAIIAETGNEFDFPLTMIADKIKNGDNYNLKKAKDDIYRHLENARILKERVIDNTFPFDKNGDWKLE